MLKISPVISWGHFFMRMICLLSRYKSKLVLHVRLSDPGLVLNWMNQNCTDIGKARIFTDYQTRIPYAIPDCHFIYKISLPVLVDPNLSCGSRGRSSDTYLHPKFLTALTLPSKTYPLSLHRFTGSCSCLAVTAVSAAPCAKFYETNLALFASAGAPKDHRKYGIDRCP